MEHPLKRSLFVEFYGLPGCGKSTVSHLVASKLRDEGYLVDEPSYEIDRNCSPFLRKIKKLSFYFYWFIFHNKKFKKVNTIVVRNGYSGIAKIEQTSNVLQKISVYQKSEQNRMVIWDQGLVQASISLSLKGKINAGENLMNILHILDPDVETFNVLISVDEQVALERMSQRPTNDSRVEKLKNKNQKHEMMSRFQHEIDLINKGNVGIVIAGVLDIEKQVSDISGAILRAVRNEVL